MPSKKKAVQTAAAANRRILDPEPPRTLWEDLDALYIENAMVRTAKQPPDTFTAASEARRCGLHASSMSLRFQRLLKEGKLEFVSTGTNNQKFYRIKK